MKKLLHRKSATRNENNTKNMQHATCKKVKHETSTR